MNVGLLILSSAIITKSGYFIAQNYASSKYNPIRLSYYTALIGFITLIPLAVYTGATANFTISPSLALAIAGAGFFNIVGLYAFVTAVEASDLSAVMPLRDTIPIHVAILEPLLLGTIFTINIFIGALLAGIGAYITLANDGLLKPLQRLPERGQQFAVVTAISYSFASIFARFITQQMPSIVYTGYIYGIMVVVFYLLARTRVEDGVKHSNLRTGALILGGVGFLSAVRTALTFETFARFSATEATVFFRVALILSVGAGIILYKETGWKHKLVGSLFIIAGVAVTAL